MPIAPPRNKAADELNNQRVRVPALEPRPRHGRQQRSRYAVRNHPSEVKNTTRVQMAAKRIDQQLMEAEALIKGQESKDEREQYPAISHEWTGRVSIGFARAEKQRAVDEKQAGRE
jgi:hypothetical protein